MRASLSKLGHLTIHAETPVEAFALRQWAHHATQYDKRRSTDRVSIFNVDGRKIFIDTKFKE